MVARHSTFKKKILLSFIVLICSVFDLKATNQHVIYLNSYSLEMEWAAKITEGVQEVFYQYPQYELHIEFLDVKEISDSVYFDYLFELMQLKYKDKKPSQIICSDNGAMDFLLQYYDSALFSGVPVAFCGLNNTREYTFPENFYGIDQNPLIENELNLIIELFPNVEVVYVLVDKTVTGEIYRGKYDIMKETLHDVYTIEYIDQVDMDSIASVVQNFNKNGVINYLTVNLDKYGNLVKPSNLMPLIVNNTSLPVFGNPIGANREGLVGGLMQSGKYHGEQCAGIAIQMLKNQLDAYTPQVVSPKVKFGFNYPALKKHGIEISDLPEGATLLNVEEGLFQKYKRELILLTITLVLLVFVIVLLSINIVRRREAEASRDMHIKEVESKNGEIHTINAELNASNSQLEKLNLTLSHTNIKLINAKEFAEKSNQLKSAFLFNISHEIRTPLNSIIGFSEMLLNEKLSPKDKEKYSNIVTENASRLLETVENVLEYSRIETGAEKVVLENFVFMELVQQVIHKFTPTLKERGNSISCIFKKKQKLSDVFLDKSKCIRILEILLITANRLNENQEFTLTCTPVSKFRFQVQLLMGSVDIELAELDAIFEPYAEKFINAHHLLDGNGVSLTIARGYIEMLNGTVFASLHQDGQFSINMMLPYKCCE